MAGEDLRGETWIRVEELSLDHNVMIPTTLVNALVPFVSPWFTNAQFSEANLFWRIGMDPWVEEKHRPLWFQGATREEMMRLKSNPHMKTLEESTGTLTDLILTSLEVSVEIDVAEECNTATLDPDDKKYITTLERFLLLDDESRETVVPEDFPKWVESKTLTLSVSMTVMKPVVLSSREDGLSQVPGLGGCNVRARDTLQMMLSDELLPDVRLKLKDGTVCAHRAVLAANSAVFKAMFQHDTKENQSGEVEIQDLSVDVMKIALNYFYGKEIDCTDPDLLTNLLALAERYELLGLKGICEDALGNTPSLNVLELLLLADTHNASRLRSVAMCRIANSPNRKELVDDATIKAMLTSHPKVVADLLKLVF